uniref:Uncharacterized protein n=1 Tax=Trieres chinensis TaxID=1514140 RepID=A0A7S2A424_TRICV
MTARSAALSAALILAAALQAAATSAGGPGGSAPPSPPSGGGGGVGGGDDNGPQFSLSREISFDPSEDRVEVEAETEAVAFFASDAKEEEVDASAEAASAPEAGGVVAHVQSSALYCSGGADDLSGGSPIGGAPGSEDPRGFVAVAECRFGLAMDLDSDADDESDDDDDDDDDGHSSMLSTASLRRSLASANGAGTAYAGSPSKSDEGATSGSRKGRYGHPGSMPRSRGADVAFLSRSNAAVSSRPSSSALNAALGVRGGASAAPSKFAERLIVAALVTVLYEACLGHLLEFIKIVMQTSPPGTSYIDVLRAITAEKGIAGVWDGFIPWGVVQSVFKGGVFGLAHAMASSYLNPLADKGVLPKQLALTLAGGIGGGFQGYVLSPTLLLKTRVMTNPVFREKMSLVRTTFLSLTIGFDVVAQEGILALMKGSNVFAIKRVLDWSTRYFFSDLFEAMLLSYSASDSLTNGEKAAASLLGGTASTISTLPLDVLVAKTQDAKKAGAKVSAVELLKEELAEGGWKRVWDTTMQGFEARLAHVCFTTVVMKTFSPIVFDMIFGQK